MKIRPLGDRIIVKREAEEHKSAGGIVIPDTAREKPVQGRITAVGPGRWLKDGKRRTPDIKEGDLVLFDKYAGSEVKLGEDKLLVMREEDIIAVVEP